MSVTDWHHSLRTLHQSKSETAFCRPRSCVDTRLADLRQLWRSIFRRCRPEAVEQPSYIVLTNRYQLWTVCSAVRSLRIVT